MENLFLMILKMGITAVPVILSVFLVRWMIRRAPKRYSYVLWAVVGLRLVFPFSVSSVFSLFNLKLFKNTGVGRNAMQPVMGELSGSRAAAMPEAGRQIMDAVSTGARTSAAVSSGEIWQYLLKGAAAIWAVGVLACLIYFLISWFRVKKNVKHAVRWKDNIWECEAVSSPFVMGVFRPKIYIPFHLDAYERKMLLLHEKYHIRRKDYLVKLFAFLAAAVYWFQPLVWAAYFAMMKDMEMSCDEWVLECLGTDCKKAYSSLLLDFAVDRRRDSLSGILGFGENSTKSRVRNILNFKHPGRLAAAALAVLCIAVFVFLGTNGKDESAAAVETEVGTVTDEPESQSEDYSGLAEQLYALKNPYVGDASADEKLFREILREMGLSSYDDFWDSYSISLETEEEPYAMWIEFTQIPQDTQSTEIHMADCGNLLLALIDNLSEVRFTYPTEIREKIAVETDADAGTEIEGESITLHWNLEAAKTNLWGNDVKSYGESEESLANLLMLMNTGRQREIAAARSEGSFGSMEAVPVPAVDAVPESSEAAEETDETYVSYYLQDSTSPEKALLIPELSLYKTEKTFTFSYDVISSYLSHGTYEIEDGILTAVTDDGNYHYQFKVIDENTLEFLQEGSSDVRLVDDRLGAAIQDGAIFEKR